MFAIDEKSQGMVFKVFVQPRASKNKVVGLYEDALKIKLTAPPVDGAANRMCIQYLAKCLKVSKSVLEVVSGQSSRTKRILWHFDGKTASPADRQKIRRRIEALLATK